MNIGYTIRSNNIDTILQQSLSRLLSKDCGEVGITKVDPAMLNAGGTREQLGATIVLENPRNRWILNGARKHNFIAQIAESLWVLAGSNDVDWLEQFLPRAREFSDDGKTWRAGYGPLLRKYTGVDDNGAVVTVDGLYHAYHTLKHNKSSRQVVVNLWDNAKNAYVENSKDYPCNDLIQFMIRENQLHMGVYVRSNDAIWGMTGVNIVEWTLLQEIMAGMLGVGVGQYWHNAFSFHIYNRHLDRAENIIDEYDICRDSYRSLNDAGAAVNRRMFDGFREDQLSFEKVFGHIDLMFRLLSPDNLFSQEEVIQVLQEIPNSQFKAIFCTPFLKKFPNMYLDNYECYMHLPLQLQTWFNNKYHKKEVPQHA